MDNNSVVVAYASMNICAAVETLEVHQRMRQSIAFHTFPTVRAHYHERLVATTTYHVPARAPFRNSCDRDRFMPNTSS
jgi:hypothetical protein